MNKAGWTLIIVGLALIVVRSLLDFWILLKPRAEGSEPSAVLAALTGVDLSLKDLADLLRAPHGAGVALVITGALLLLAGSGVDVSFGGSVETPTPTPSTT